MRLNYEILWFENDKTSFSVKKKFVQSFLEEEGFNFIEPRNEVDGSNIATIPFNNYDLIIADLKLDNNEKGTDLLKFIREDKQIFTEVLFYSSDGEDKVRELLKDHGIDGAYCADRRNEDFEHKVKEVIKTTIKKVQDINNMRGLVMAEVAELDNKMVEILKLFSQNIDEKQRALFVEKRKKRVLESLDKMSNAFKEVSETDLFEHRDFNTYHKWMTMKHVLKSFKDADIQQELNNYYQEIIEKRNKLAHVQEIISADGQVSLEDGEFIFNDEVCREIRKDLQKHTKNFAEIKKKLIA